MRLVFGCKEPRLAAHYQRIFGELFTAELQEHRGGDRTALSQRWDERMTAEAARQQHYDYVLQGDGDFVPHRRELLRDADGTPTLLIPTLTVVKR